MFHEPIELHLVLGDDGPERVGPDREGRWMPFLATQIRSTAIAWERLEIGPARLADGRPARGWQAALVITIVLAVAGAYGFTRRQQR